MLRIESGNAWQKSAMSPNGMKNGWFFGSSRFINDDSLRQCEDMEIKWSIHHKGWDSGIKPCSPFLGMSILIQGKFSILFRETEADNWQEHWMITQGDFIVSKGGVQHISKAHEDSIILTVRLARDAETKITSASPSAAQDASP